MDTLDYSKAKLYKLVSEFSDKTYVGGTIHELSVRESEHQADYDRWIKGHPSSHYITSYELIRLGKFRIELLENFPCNSRRELDERERYWIENTPNCVNKYIPFRTYLEAQKLWKNNHPEYMKEYAKKHWILNKERLSQRRAEKITCKCGAIIARGGKAAHEKTQKHKEAMKVFE